MFENIKNNQAKSWSLPSYFPQPLAIYNEQTLSLCSQSARQYATNAPWQKQMSKTDMKHTFHVRLSCLGNNTQKKGTQNPIIFSKQVPKSAAPS